MTDFGDRNAGGLYNRSFGPPVCRDGRIASFIEVCSDYEHSARGTLSDFIYASLGRVRGPPASTIYMANVFAHTTGTVAM